MPKILLRHDPVCGQITAADGTIVGNWMGDIHQPFPYPTPEVIIKHEKTEVEKIVEVEKDFNSNELINLKNAGFTAEEIFMLGSK